MSNTNRKAIQLHPLLDLNLYKFLQTILTRLQGCDFEPNRSVLAFEEALERFQVPHDLFDLDQLRRGGLAGTEKLYFEIYEKVPDSWNINATNYKTAFSGNLEKSTVRDIARVIKDSGQLTHDDFKKKWMRRLPKSYFKHLKPPKTGQRRLWPDFKRPGISRREHASVLIQSRLSRVLTDPQQLNSGWTTDEARIHDARTPSIDAIAITHSHDDHWHVPSILTSAKKRTKIFVPSVPRANLLCPINMKEILQITGEKAIELDWWKSEQVNDMRITSLPFFGEQPLRDGKLPQNLRNWGNTYRFDTKDFSAVVLADSGVDHEGSVIDALTRSVASDGPIDIVLSCCASFPEAINPGLQQYFLCVPFWQLQEIWQKTRLQPDSSKSMTLGPRGIAEACRAAQARYFLPYAHGLFGLPYPGNANRGGVYSMEQGYLGLIETELKKLGSSTQVIHWKCGDFISMKEKGPLELLSSV